MKIYLFFHFSFFAFKTFIHENELFYTRQQELDVLLVELDRHLNDLTTSYEIFASIHKDNQRELEIKFEKHQVKIILFSFLLKTNFFSNYFN